VSEPHAAVHPIVLDSSVLVAYERMKSPGSAAMHETQAWIGGWLLRGTQLLIPAVSLAVASVECEGRVPELDYLLRGDPDLVTVVPLISSSAVDVGAAVAASGGKELLDLEIAQVVWCAIGHAAEEDPAERWPVATYWPDWYAEKAVPIIAL